MATTRSGGIPAWTVQAIHTVYDGSPSVRVDLAQVTAPDGTKIEHHVLRIPRAAIALVVDEAVGTVLMLRRQRWVVDQWGYELLGGLVEEGEDPADTARREALEESGWRPRGPAEHLITVHPLPGIADTIMDIYLWRGGADHLGNPTDPYEVGTLEWISLDRARRLVQEGQMLGAGSVIALLRYFAGTPPVRMPS